MRRASSPAPAAARAGTPAWRGRLPTTPAPVWLPASTPFGMLPGKAVWGRATPTPMMVDPLPIAAHWRREQGTQGIDRGERRVKGG
jgi:hypothetical protein